LYLQARKAGKTVLDQWDYIMHGKIFKRKEYLVQGIPHLEITVSFGGLLLRMRGDPKKLEDLEEDSNIFLLMRKV
jgi:DNA-directed RNA polymerases I, II, and III subunit RPABC3